MTRSFSRGQFRGRPLGFDHGVGHPLLLLCRTEAPNYRKKKAFEDLDYYSEWPKVADAVIKARHRLILCWLVFMQALYLGRKTLEELARWTPAQVTVWRFRRLLKASYWHVHLLVEWWAQEALAT